MCLTMLCATTPQRARNKNVDAITAAVWNAAADCEINDDLCRRRPICTNPSWSNTT